LDACLKIWKARFSNLFAPRNFPGDLINLVLPLNKIAMRCQLLIQPSGAAYHLIKGMTTDAVVCSVPDIELVHKFLGALNGFDSNSISNRISKRRGDDLANALILLVKLLPIGAVRADVAKEEANIMDDVKNVFG
jgi:hypothetical protein